MNLAHAGVVQKDAASLNRVSANPPDVRFRAGNALINFLAFVLTGSAASKLLPVQSVAVHMAPLGFAGGKLIFIAILEIASALLFAYRLILRLSPIYTRPPCCSNSRSLASYFFFLLSLDVL